MRMKENCFVFFSFIDYNTLDNFRLEIASLVLNERTKTMQTIIIMKKVKLNYSFVIGYIAFNKTAESETAFFAK